MNERTVHITQGDPLGIGLEITIKALHQIWLEDGRLPSHNLLCVPENFERCLKYLDTSLNTWARFHVVRKSLSGPFVHANGEFSDPGVSAAMAIEMGARLCGQDPKCHSLVTAPIHKARMQPACGFAGHTEYLQALTKAPNVRMLLRGPELAVILQTIHVPLNQVKIDPQELEKTFDFAYQFAGDREIWVMGLNPHAGDSGVIGQEEITIISPTIEKWKKANPLAKIKGPMPADGIWHHWKRLSSSSRPGVFIAMYHDQGLIPIKLWEGESAINQTLGLPFIRTSPDHGTADDICGKNMADYSSMYQAIRVANAGV